MSKFSEILLRIVNKGRKHDNEILDINQRLDRIERQLTKGDKTS